MRITNWKQLIYLTNMYWLFVYSLFGMMLGDQDRWHIWQISHFSKSSWEWPDCWASALMEAQFLHKKWIMILPSFIQQMFIEHILWGKHFCDEYNTGSSPPVSNFEQNKLNCYTVHPTLWDCCYAYKSAIQ